MSFPSAAFFAASTVFAGTLAASEVSIPAGINSWAFDETGTCLPRQAVATKQGIAHWSDPTVRIRIFFWMDAQGPLNIRLLGTVVGDAKIRCSLHSSDPPTGRETDAAATSRPDEATDVPLSADPAGSIPIGAFTIVKPGYHYLELQGLSRTSDTYAEVASVVLSGAFSADQVHYIKDDVHFGRRGPSVHLSYQLPKAAHDIAYYYSEVCVPVGKDAVGTFCMANGFAQGYSGMQVNSATERRILFSVWSPFKTDDPKAIPEADRVTLLKKGADVRAQAFGGEGSGGQSFLIYPWKAGTTYRFLLRGEPGSDGTTSFTAYFSPQPGRWLLLASFRRPRTTTWLTGWHSFLENFSPDAGAITREATFDNQWACDRNGQWFTATTARFTADETARKQARLDYTGGLTTDGRFFLRNCGFFTERLAIGSIVSRPAEGHQPAIDLATLP